MILCLFEILKLIRLLSLLKGLVIFNVDVFIIGKILSFISYLYFFMNLFVRFFFRNEY